VTTKESLKPTLGAEPVSTEKTVPPFQRIRGMRRTNPSQSLSELEAELVAKIREVRGVAENFRHTLRSLQLPPRDDLAELERVLKQSEELLHRCRDPQRSAAKVRKATGVPSALGARWI